MVTVLAALSSAVLLWAAFPPVDAGVLALVAPVPLLVRLRTAPSTGPAVAAGALFGLAFFTGLFWWIGRLGLVALIPLALSQAAYPTLYGWLLGRVRTWSTHRWAVVAIGGWAALELVRERFPVGGFAWGLLGYPLGAYPPSRAVAQWVGASGLSVIVMAVAVGLTLALRRESFRWLGGAAVTAVALTVAGGLWPAVADGPEVRVAIVQGSTPCPGTHCADERLLTYEAHLALTRSLPPDRFDLVVWAESSTGFSVDPVLNTAVAESIGQEARRLNAFVMVGTDRPVGADHFINANVFFGPDGALIGEYQKVHPVPFGEYIPLRPVFEWIPALEQVPRDMIRGAGMIIFRIPAGRLGSVISFEGSFARYPRAAVRAGAQLLVVATNQNSYGFSPASDQFIAMSRVHSSELGIDIVQAAVTGRSAILVEGGEVVGPSELSEPALLTGTVHMRAAGPTFYARVGDWLQVVATLALGVALLARQERPSDDDLSMTGSRAEPSPGTSR